MALIPISIPPGVYRNGTELDSSGRWYDVNLVRWVEGMMRPVGGWQARTSTALTGKARGMIAWRSNNSTRYISVGTHSKLYAITQSSVIVDITPTGFVPGNPNASVGGGYGVGLYSAGYYGTPRPDVGSVTPATTWTLDTWGEYLVGCSNYDGKIYEWQLDTTTPTKAAVVTNAPTSNTGVLVTNERSMFALGASGNPRKIAWSDLENNTIWTPASTNLAGSLELQTGGKIITAKRVRGQVLVLTDIDAIDTAFEQPDNARVRSATIRSSRHSLVNFTDRLLFSGDHHIGLISFGLVNRRNLIYFSLHLLASLFAFFQSLGISGIALPVTDFISRGRANNKRTANCI